MIVTVKYGENDSLLVNTDCRVNNLLKYIRQKCSPVEEVIDLSDEKGKLKNLRFKLEDFGKDHVTPRESLILIAVRISLTPDGAAEVEEDEAATTVPKQTLVPLLTSKLKDQHFMTKLNKPRMKSVTMNEATLDLKTDAKSKKTTSASSSSSSSSAAAATAASEGVGAGDKKSTKNANAKSSRQKLAPKNSKT